MQISSISAIIRRLLLIAGAVAIILCSATDLDAKRKKTRRSSRARTSQAIMGTKSDKYIVVDKEHFTLTVFSGDGATVATYPVSVGTGIGQKRRAGDHCTPEGDFTIWQIQNSASWTHNFHDGHGERKGAYGPWFFRLRCKQSPHIGIHGTCFPETTGKRASEGCIRLRNEDLLDLRQYVYVGMPVTILPDL